MHRVVRRRIPYWVSLGPEPAEASGLGEKSLKRGAPSGFRTPDPLIKSQLLYQLS